MQKVRLNGVGGTLISGQRYKECFCSGLWPETSHGGVLKLSLGKVNITSVGCSPSVVFSLLSTWGVLFLGVNEPAQDRGGNQWDTVFKSKTVLCGLLRSGYTWVQGNQPRKEWAVWYRATIYQTLPVCKVPSEVIYINSSLHLRHNPVRQIVFSLF